MNLNEDQARRLSASKNLDSVIDEFEQGIAALGRPSLEEVQGRVDAALRRLTDRDLVSIGDEHRLGELGLEVRVRQIFQEMRFIYLPGPKGQHDGIVKLTGNESRPVVLEIKSGKNPGPSRDNLRQLDDWVFELSGEEQARRGPVPAQGGTGALLTGGLGVRPMYNHPTPHKGVLIYNGPINTGFNDRIQDNRWITPNELEFAKKRCFCIASFGCLLAWHEASKGDPAAATRLWEELHATVGVLPYPTDVGPASAEATDDEIEFRYRGPEWTARQSED